MRLDDLYPYWESVHQELLETIGILTDALLDARPREDAPGIQQIVVQLLLDERYFIAHLIGGYVLERPVSADFTSATALVEALAAARDVTTRVLEPISPEGLRAVRTLPADPAVSRPETNVPISWLIWHLLEIELFAIGQIKLRIDDNKTARPRWG